MQLADSLERAQALREAALEYRLVAELYPTTSHYVEAVRKSALLHSSPSNPYRSDSTSLYWFRKYVSLPISREERSAAEVYVFMLEQMAIQQNSIKTIEMMVDSLQAALRKQSAELASKGKKVQDLEADLKRTTTELQNLRDVDVRINKRKGR
ncbi:MAG: hypothetical protein HY961_04730 [Ignavibacteriae bacterium]|nr:hypothetical protein [Ignavibacteriota bacterium]